MDKDTIFHSHRPCQSPILESPAKLELLNGMMAHKPPEIQLQDQIHPWKGELCS
jgi:hypothetical protein